MIRAIIIFFLIFIYVFSAYASENIDFSVSQSEVELGEYINLDISVNASEISLDAVQFQIPGIENFDVFSQSQSESYSNINGEVQRDILYSLSVSPSSVGTFNIGPVTLVTQNENIRDDTSLSIEVFELGTIPRSSNEENTISNSVEELSDITGLRVPGYSWWGILAISIIILMFLYFLLQKILFSSEQAVIKQETFEETSDVYSIYKEYFLSLGSEIGKISSRDFFRKYNTGVRKILVLDGFESAETDTLSELSSKPNILKSRFFQILKETYSSEYRENEVSIEEQNKFITKIIKELK